MKKVIVSIETTDARVCNDRWRFLDEETLENVNQALEAYEEEDGELYEEIEDNYGGLASYIDELIEAPEPEELKAISRAMNEDCIDFKPWGSLSICDVQAMVDGQSIFSHNDWGFNWEKDAVEQEGIKPRQAIKELINSGKFKKIHALYKYEADSCCVTLQFSFEIDGEFDMSKFHLIKGQEGGVLADAAVYDGKRVEGDNVADSCPDHADYYLVTFTASRCRKKEIESY